jgi:hypothetical protein
MFVALIRYCVSGPCEQGGLSSFRRMTFCFRWCLSPSLDSFCTAAAAGGLHNAMGRTLHGAARA